MARSCRARGSALSALFAAVLALVAAAPAAAGFHQPRIVGESPSLRPDVDVAPSGASVAAWQLGAPSGSVQASYRPDRGRWFGAGQVVSATGGIGVESVRTAKAADGSAIVVWERDNGTNDVIEAAIRGPAESAFRPAERLSAAGDNAWNAEVAAGGTENVFVVTWVRATPGSAGTVQQRTLSATSLGPEPENVSTGSAANDPSVDVGRNGVTTIAWVESNLINARTRDTPGGSFAALTTLTEDTSQFARNPDVAVDASGASAVVWERGEQVRISYKPGPGPWTASQLVDNPASSPQVDLDGLGRATIVYEWTPPGQRTAVAINKRETDGSFSGKQSFGGGTEDDSIKPQLDVVDAGPRQGDAIFAWWRSPGTDPAQTEDDTIRVTTRRGPSGFIGVGENLPSNGGAFPQVGIADSGGVDSSGPFAVGTAIWQETEFSLVEVKATDNGPPSSMSPPHITHETGEPRVGQDLTANSGGWNGDATSFGYTWQRCATTGATCTSWETLTGTDGCAAENCLRLTSDEEGRLIRVKVQATNANGTSPPIDSSPVGPVVASGPSGPAVTVTPGSHNFGDTTVGGTSASQEFTLTNTGSAPLDVLSINWTGPFESGATPQNCLVDPLPPGASCKFSAVFKPTAAGAATGSIVVSTDAAGSPTTIPLSGNGVTGPVAAAQIQVGPEGGWNFGSVKVGTVSETFGFEVKNVGNAPLSITAPVSYTGPFGPSSKEATTCTPGTTLAPGAACAVYPVFAPTAAGEVTGSLTVHSDAPGGAVTRTLKGTGAAETTGGGDVIPPTPPSNPSLNATRPPSIQKIVRMPNLRPGSAKCPRVVRRDESGSRVRLNLCTILTAQQGLDKAGIVNRDLVVKAGDIDDVPDATLRSRLKRVGEDGDVINTVPLARTPVEVPTAVPGVKLPQIKLLVLREPQMRISCNDRTIEQLLNEAWPGETTGRGTRRRYGAQDVLEKLPCRYSVVYDKRDNVSTPYIAAIKPGGTVKVTVAISRTTELAVTILEDRDSGDVTITERGHLPTTNGGAASVLAQVMNTSYAPSKPMPGAIVQIYDPSGLPVAIGDRPTDGAGITRLGGRFPTGGSYKIFAQVMGDNEASLDAPVTKLRVRENIESPMTTPSGRVFKGGNGRPWKLVPPSQVTASAVARPAAVCSNPSVDRDAVARFLVSDIFKPGLVQLRGATTAERRQELTGQIMIAYLFTRQEGVLQRPAAQKYLDEAKLSVVNLGAGDLPAVDCDQSLTTQAEELVRGGYRLDQPLPVLRIGATNAFRNGTITTPLIFDPAASFKVVSPIKPVDSLGLTLDQRVTLFQAAAALAAGNRAGAFFDPNHPFAAVAKNAAAGVIASGGGNLTPTGNGLVFDTGGLVLDPAHMKAVLTVIASGGGNVIASGGGNFTDLEKNAINKIKAAVIASGGGNVIASGGGNLANETMIRALFKVIASGGGNVIASGGGNVIASGGGNYTDALRDAIGAAVIASGGGNVIASGGGNLLDAGNMLQGLNGVIASGGGNVIASGGGNLQTRLQAVIASGGGNLAPAGLDVKGVLTQLIGQAGTNLIGQAGTNLTSQLGRIGNVIASGGGNVIASGGGNVIVGQDTGVIASGGGN